MRNYNLARRGEIEDIDPFFREFFDLDPYYENKSHNLMKTDIKENNDSYDLAIDLPGIKKEDVKMSYDNGYLTVNVTHEENKDEKGKDNYIKKERFYGNYSRSYYFGDDVDKNSISAKLENGTLEVSVKKAKAQPDETKYISIQ